MLIRELEESFALKNERSQAFRWMTLTSHLQWRFGMQKGAIAVTERRFATSLERGRDLIYKHCLRVSAVILFTILPMIAAAKSPHPHTIKANTRFLAASTCIRGTWGQNLDVYLAEIVTQKESEPVLIRLIDEYRNLDPPLSVDALTSTTGTTLRIRRDALCDMPYGAMQLRTAPGDPMAILHERLGFQPQMSWQPESTAILPCYRTVRR
jgi:hypothetical protein